MSFAELHDKSLIASQCEDISDAICALRDRLHNAGMHSQATAAGVAAGMIECIQDDLIDDENG